VDFSGAKTDKDTWVTQGVLDGGVLTIESCQSVTRAQLANLLASLPGTAVAALDFPFSVPTVFAQQWLPDADAMPQLWAAAAAMTSEGFLSLRDEFVAEHGEPLRRGDLYFPECYSCLHKANPNMVPMTFRGMQMLDALWRAGCRVPPLPEQGRSGPLLLESMPGAALRAFGLPFKGYKKGQRAVELRRQILDGLESRSGVTIPNLAQFRDYCMGNDDCLDSVVAAVAACLWRRDPALFRRPKDGPGDATKRGGAPSPDENELATARLEGWLYAPVFLDTPASVSA
jgi:predicted RNase H-like nuclease